MGDKAEDSDEPPAVSENPIDPIEGTSSTILNESPVDECSNDSSTSISNPGEVADCDTCQKTAVLKTFITRIPTNGGKSEDILRNFCESCNQFFGMCSKKVRGTFSFTTEEGRILTNAEKMEYLRDQKRKISLPRKDSITETEPSPSSDTSTTGISEEKEEEDLNIGQPPEVQPRKKPTFAKKKKKNNWTTRKSKKGPVAKSDGPSTSAKRSTSSSTSTSTKKKDTDRLKEIKPFPVPSLQKQRSGRSVGKGIGKSSSAVDFNKEIPRQIEHETVETAEAEVQTDSDLILRSACLENTFNQTLEKNFNENLSARLKEQPMIVKKQFVMMIRTIQEQEAVITRLKAMEENYQVAVRKLKEFGRNTRLTYSDSFRLIRADMVERKEEFKAHQAEVISIMKKQKVKYEAYKQEMTKKYDDFQLEKTSMEAKINYLEHEKNYEKDLCAFYMRSNDVYEKEKNDAVNTAEAAEEKLRNRLFVANNQFCTHCKVKEAIRKKMTEEVAEMTAKTEKAMVDKDSAEEKAKLFESAAQKLGRDCDAIKYERDSWKAYAERFKKENNSLTQKVKEKERELLQLMEKEKEKAAEVMVTPKSTSTPKSVACTPNETDRVSPPEEGEILDTPPQNSPIATPSSSIPKPVVKPLVQKIAEKKVAAVPIASGFASWIPKDKLNEPAPEIPKALSAFGAPIKTPQQREAERARMAPSLQPTPWEKAAMGSVPTSDSLIEALNKVQADSFFGGSTSDATPPYASKSYTEEINRAMKARKRTSDVEQAKKPPVASSAESSSPAPPLKKTKPMPGGSDSTSETKPYKSLAPATSTSSNSSLSSLGAMKKIPKLSDKPPQAEFAAALGVKSNSDQEGIPGFGNLDEAVKEKAEPPKKILPVETKPKPAASNNQQNQNQKGQPHSNKNNSVQKKKNSPPGKKQHNRQDSFHSAPWHRQESSSPWSQPPQNHYGIQSNSRGGAFQMDFDRPWSDAPPRDREQFGSLPWHHRSQDTPFGKVPIQDTFTMGPMSRGGPPMGMGMPMRGGMPPPQRPPPMGFYNNEPPRDNGYFPPQNQYSPPNSAGRGNPRSFYS